MAQTYSYNSLNLNDGSVYTVTYDEGAEAQQWAPRRHIRQEYAASPGGVLLTNAPGMRVITLGGALLGNVTTGTWDTNRDALEKALSFPKRALIVSNLDTRRCIATCEELRTRVTGPFSGTWQATFVSESPYMESATPLVDTRTPTFAQVPVYRNQPSGNRYGLAWGLNIAGTDPAQLLSYIANQSGGVTGNQWYVRNRTTGQDATPAAAVAAGSMLVVDGFRQWVYSSALTNIVGFWPFFDASGSPRDLSSNSRDLTVTGSLTYAQDGPLGFPHLVALTGFTNSNYLSNNAAAFGITGAMTFGAWVKADSFSGNRFIMSKASLNNGWSLYMNASEFGVIVSNNVANRTITGMVMGASPIVATYYFVAGTFSPSGSNNRLRIWVGTENQPPRIEGEVTAVGGFSGNPTAGANDLLIGRGHNQFDGGANAFVGSICQPWVANVEMTEEELTDIWRYGLPAYNRSFPDGAVGMIPHLDPRRGSNNVFEVSAIHATTPHTTRVASAYRSQFN